MALLAALGAENSPPPIVVLRKTTALTGVDIACERGVVMGKIDSGDLQIEFRFEQNTS